jgi:hypothetical protein
MTEQRIVRRWIAQVATVSTFAAITFLAIGPDWSEAQGQEKQKTKAPPVIVVQKKKSANPMAKARPVPGVGQKLEVAALAKLIDAEINRQLKAEAIPASPKADDAEFHRRVYLDLVGVVPPVDKTVAFLESTDPKKREKLVEELLSDERFGKSMAETWLLCMVPRESTNRLLIQAPFHKWLAEKFNANERLDKVVFDLLTAVGSQDDNGAITYWVANNTVDKRTDNITRMFLGIQLECAQCHNHPFTDYKQNDYWGVAAFFMNVRVQTDAKQAAKKGGSITIVEGNAVAKGKKAALPDSAKIVPAKFLAGEEAKIEKEPARPVFAKWATSPSNPYFAKAMVNRFWYHLFGRGLVNPVDDMHDDNPPTHPELLAALTEQLKANDFDARYLIRAIIATDAYQRTAKPNDKNLEDRTWYSHRQPRVLTPEQLHDSIFSVVGQVAKKAPEGVPAKKGPPPNTRDNFLAFFRIENADPLEYQTGIPQALRLMNSGPSNATNRVVEESVTAAKNDPAKTIENIYLRVYARRPSADETSRMMQYIEKAGVQPRVAYTDMVWAMLNSSEFVLNH